MQLQADLAVSKKMKKFVSLLGEIQYCKKYLYFCS